MTTPRMVRIVPHSHNQTITVGFGIPPNLLSSCWIRDESPHERPRATPWIAGWLYPSFTKVDYRRWGLTPRPENCTV